MISKNNVVSCPYCGSNKIFLIRIDSDWCRGIGDYSRVNDDIYYAKEELKYDSYDRPDIGLYHCLDCDKMF